jgi:hypothetical protein
MRPRYEVPEDRAKEYAAVAKVAAALDLFIANRNPETGQTLLQDRKGRPALYLEVKCRTNPAFKYEDFKISTKKIAHAQKAWDKDRIRTLLVVQFADRLMVAKLCPVPKPFPVGVIKRIDRNDPKDIEPAAEISMGKFVEMM